MVHMHPQRFRGAFAFLKESAQILKIMLSKFSHTTFLDFQWAMNRQPGSCPGFPFIFHVFLIEWNENSHPRTQTLTTHDFVLTIMN